SPSIRQYWGTSRLRKSCLAYASEECVELQRSFHHSVCGPLTNRDDDSYVDRGAEDVFHRFVRGFGKRWMGVDRIDEIIHSPFQRDCSNGFRDHLRHRISDHVNAENLSVLFIRDDLYETIAGIFNLGF